MSMDHDQALKHKNKGCDEGHLWCQRWWRESVRASVCRQMWSGNGQLPLVEEVWPGATSDLRRTTSINHDSFHMACEFDLRTQDTFNRHSSRFLIFLGPSSIIPSWFPADRINNDDHANVYWYKHIHIHIYIYIYTYIYIYIHTYQDRPPVLDILGARRAM